MTSNIFKIPKQTFGFFSITVAWTATMIIYAIFQALKYGKAQESGVIIFWSGLFVFIAWAIFIILPLEKLNHSRKIFDRKVFPFVTGLYAAVAYSLLVGGLFQSIDLLLSFLIWAIIIGVLFGFTYSTLISSKTLLALLNKKPFLKIFSPLSPIIFLAFFLWLLPTLFPSLLFRFMPDEIQNQIVLRTLPKFRKGDKFSKLENSLPGYFDEWVLDGNGGVSSSGPLLDYELNVKNDTIQKLVIKIKN